MAPLKAHELCLKPHGLHTKPHGSHTKSRESHMKFHCVVSIVILGYLLCEVSPHYASNIRKRLAGEERADGGG